MGTKSSQITVNGMVIDVERKKIKNLNLTVYAPTGRVRVSVPPRVNDEAVRLFVTNRLEWIKRQQAKFAAKERQPAPQYVTGESHYFQGDRYLLNIEYKNPPPKVVIRNNIINLYVRPDSDAAFRERVMLAWYRQQLKAQIPALIAKWEPIMGVTVADWGVKQMKTRWGTCNIRARRIWLNLELSKKSIACLEYVVVHEMVHLLERYHNERFKAFMTQFLPQWRLLQAALNRDSLDSANWDY